MKLFSKVLCILSVLVLCVPFFCLSVSADESSEDEILPSYYGIDTFKANADGSGFKMKAEDIDANGLPTFFEQNAINISSLENQSNLPSPYYNIDGNTYNLLDNYVLFTQALKQAVIYNNLKMNTTDEYYYITFFLGCINAENTMLYKRCYVYLSTKPFSFSSNGSGEFVINGDLQYYGSAKVVEYHSSDRDYIGGRDFSGNKSQYLKYDSSLNPITGESLTEYPYQIVSKCYTNFNIDTSMFDSDENLVKGLGELKKESFDSAVSVTTEPKFTTDMIRTSDYFEFSVTNNYNVPVQWVAYIIDESYDYSEYQYGEKADYSSGVYDYKVKDYMAHFEFELGGCKWLYLSDEYFYTFKSERDDFLWGVTQTYNYSLSKNHGSSYWHFLKKGETFSDRIYWENVGITADKEYSIRFRAIPVPETFECASLLFDKEWILNDPISYVEWHTNESNIADTYKLDYEWYTFDVEFILSDTLKNMYLDSDNVKFIYNSKFSIDDVPAYSSVTPNDSKSNTSSGFLNDKNTVFDANYKLNVETGEEEFIDLSVSNNNSFDVGDVSAEDVSEYLDFSEGFFSLLGTVFSYLPPFIWALIAFGLTAFIVIAIAKWIIT